MAYIDFRRLYTGSKRKKAFVGHAELVDVLRANIVPDAHRVTLYYTGNAPIPPAVYGASNTDRLIYKVSEGHYIIVPDNPRNRACIDQNA